MKLSNWHVLYTRSRAEKKAADDLRRYGYDVYLPLQRSLRQWSDRKKWVELPVLPSYLFVRTPTAASAILECSPHVLAFVREEGRAACLREGEIEEIKYFLNNYRNVQLETGHWKTGQEVRIQRGPMRGQVGELISIKGNKARLRIDLLHVDLVAEMALPHLEAI